MHRGKTLVILALCWATAALVQAATVDEARQLYKQGEELAARRCLSRFWPWRRMVRSGLRRWISLG